MISLKIDIYFSGFEQCLLIFAANTFNMIKKLFSYLLYCIYLLLIVGVGLEIFLRFYSPIEVRISSGKVVLPKNQKYLLPNKSFDKLAKNAVHTKNSWGFRGEEWDPASPRVKVLFVGGSTTECYFSDDKNVWTSLYARQLGKDYLVNNAGLNGHSTFGHITLLTEYIRDLKPDYVFFLAGINDVAVSENGANAFDNKISGNNLEGFVIRLEERSRLLNLLHSFYRSYQARKLDLADNLQWNLADKKSKYLYSEKEKEEIFRKHEAAQAAYAGRLKQLISLCRSVNATPVFITQPLLFGQGTDPATGMDLGSFPIYGMTGREYYQKLDYYNETMRKTGAENGVAVIDLAAFLPHDSRYYTDDMHFSDAGAVKIAEILHNKIEFDSNKQLHIKE